MKKVLVSRPIFPDVIERLQQYFHVDANPGEPLSADEFARRLSPCDGALVAGDAVTAKALQGAPNLKVVSNMAVGYNNFDIPAFNAQGVLGTNTPDVLNETTADFGWALMMAAARRIAQAKRAEYFSNDLVLGHCYAGSPVLQVPESAPGALEVELLHAPPAVATAAIALPKITAPSAFPILLGDIATSSNASASFTVNATGCSPISEFVLTAPWSSSIYHTGTFIAPMSFRN